MNPLNAGNKTARVPGSVKSKGFPGNKGVSETRSFSSYSNVGILVDRQSSPSSIISSTSVGMPIWSVEMPICATAGAIRFFSVSKDNSSVSKGKENTKRSNEKRIRRLKEREKELTLLLKKKDNEKYSFASLIHGT